MSVKLERDWVNQTHWTIATDHSGYVNEIVLTDDELGSLIEQAAQQGFGQN